MSHPTDAHVSNWWNAGHSANHDSLSDATYDHKNCWNPNNGYYDQTGMSGCHGPPTHHLEPGYHVPTLTGGSSLDTLPNILHSFSDHSNAGMITTTGPGLSTNTDGAL